jgi:isopentenyl-diphosphate Delta-isomerase
LSQERVDLVDADDGVVGSATLGECLGRGLLHRAIAVVLSRPDGRVILQQRSRKDAWHAGKWTLSCTGHVRAGETYESAARRELREELGMETGLSLLAKYLLPPMKDGGLIEREWVALYTGTSGAPVKIDPVELEGVKEHTIAELKQLLAGEDLTPDSVILLTKFLGAAH